MVLFVHLIMFPIEPIKSPLFCFDQHEQLSIVGLEHKVSGCEIQRSSLLGPTILRQSQNFLHGRNNTCWSMSCCYL